MKSDKKTFLLTVCVSIVGLLWAINALSGGQLIQPLRTLYQSRVHPPVLGTETSQSTQNFIHIIPSILQAFEDSEIPDADTTATGTTTTTSGPLANTGTLPTGSVGSDEIVDVQGIQVHQSIAGQFDALMSAARNAGAQLGGSGWRDPEGQIFLRRQNCGTSNYDIYQKPSGQCSPPTAIPGTSNHERGLAADFECISTGDTVRTGDVCFNWLSNNAATYGFYNLPSESWHWSTDGH